MLYRPNSDHARDVETFFRDFQRLHDFGTNKVELVSVNTRDGAATASLYDILAYPAVLAIANDGAVLNVWPGPQLPLMDEVVGYMYR